MSSKPIENLNQLIIEINRQEPNLVSIIKHFIKSYTFKTNEELRTAVDLWCKYKEECLPKYGHISYWDVSKITDMSFLFKDKNFNEDISKWDVSNVTNMMGMFLGVESFNQHINNWDVSNVTNMDYMFSFTSSFNQPLNMWNVSNDNWLGYMFFDAISFNQPETLKHFGIE